MVNSKFFSVKKSVAKTRRAFAAAGADLIAVRGA
jgi:hypothetical protein